MSRSKRELVARVARNLVVTKVVATRSIRTSRGDHFAGFSAAFNSTQEDGGENLLSALPEGDEARSVNAMTIEESMIAAAILGRQADLAALRNAVAGGSIPSAEGARIAERIRANYRTMLAEEVTDEPGKTPTDVG